MRVGVLALQGDFREHIIALTHCQVEATEVRRVSELEKVDALIIPGGESTTIVSLAKTFEIFEPIKKRIASGMPTYGSCAGMIMLADHIVAAKDGQETFGGIDITIRRNAFGRQVDSFETEGDFAVLLKDRYRFTRNVMANHPFDVVGWDGQVYPFTFSANDFEPITGTVHLPPPIHQTFEIKGYVICTFAPRYLDHHPEAVKVPWSHDNTEADEVLFYVRGNFGSRKGIEPGSFTLHPQGIPHGPHPGTTLAAMDAVRTEELAVMFDTQYPLELTAQALALDDPNYPLSWLG